MSYLKEEEQIHVKSVEELKAVYKVLKGEWNEEYPLEQEILHFNTDSDYRYVELTAYGACLDCNNDERNTITYDEFMARVNNTTSDDDAQQEVTIKQTGTMNYLKKNEQIRIENVEQLRSVYVFLKNEWNTCYHLEQEVDDFQRIGLNYVMWGNLTICLGVKNPVHKIITYEEFMARVNAPTFEDNAQQEITDEMLSVFKVGLNMLKIDMPKSMMEKIMLFSKEVTEKGGDVTLMDVAKIEAKINDKYKDNE